MTATDTATASAADLNQTARYREKSLSRITWLAATALAASAHTKSANVTDPIVQRMASGGHSAGAGQSPVTSHGVATHWRPVTIVPATSQVPTMMAAPNRCERRVVDGPVKVHAGGDGGEIRESHQDEGSLACVHVEVPRGPQLLQQRGPNDVEDRRERRGLVFQKRRELVAVPGAPHRRIERREPAGQPGVHHASSFRSPA